MTAQTRFQFGHVAFFGRSIDEYESMLNLDLEQMRGKHVLDCPGGPAAFGSQARERGINVVAVDPLYSLPIDLLRETIDEDSAAVMQKQANNRDFIHPDVVPTETRRESMEIFLNDFAKHGVGAHYITANLPTLPFPDRHFDIVLTTNFLFEYSDNASGGMLANSPFDYKFHVLSIAELLRVCKDEVRIYPLMGPGAKRHQYLDQIIAEFQSRGHNVQLEEVTHCDIVGATQMLRLTALANQC